MAQWIAPDDGFEYRGCPRSYRYATIIGAVASNAAQPPLRAGCATVSAECSTDVL
jgi:hypothetical protein